MDEDVSFNIWAALHSLRNRLTSMIGTVQLLQQDATDSRCQTTLEVIRQSAMVVANEFEKALASKDQWSVADNAMSTLSIEAIQANRVDLVNAICKSLFMFRQVVREFDATCLNQFSTDLQALFHELDDLTERSIHDFEICLRS